MDGVVYRRDITTAAFPNPCQKRRRQGKKKSLGFYAQAPPKKNPGTVLLSHGFQP